MHERRTGITNDELIKSDLGFVRPHGNTKDIVSNFVYTAFHPWVLLFSSPTPTLHHARCHL
jgi:hypothetical protein